MGAVESPHYSMALSVSFYNIDKKLNSTLQPSESPVYTTNVVLKTPTTITSPQLQIADYPIGLVNCNYCFIPTFSRYYYITDIEFTSNNILTISTSVDVLASFKNALLADYQYIVRSSIKRDSAIQDTFYPAKMGLYHSEKTYQLVDSAVPGSYIVGIVGKKQGSIGSITGATQYVILSDTNMRNLMDYLFTAENFTEMITDDVVKTFFNPFQYIVDCMYLPFATPQLTSSELTLGWFSPPDVTALVIVSPFYQLTPQEGLIIDIPRPIADINDYRNYSPWASYRLYIPFIGWINLDSQLLKEDSQLNFLILIDLPTGEMMIKITGQQSGKIITTLSGQCCAKITMAQATMSTDVISTGINIAGAGVTAMGDLIQWANRDEGRERQRALGEQLSSIGNGISAGTTQMSSMGSTGNISQRFFETNIRLICDYYNSVDQNNSDFGSPYCKYETLSGHSGGYVQCLNPHVTGANMLESEIEECESYLTGGVFLE